MNRKTIKIHQISKMEIEISNDLKIHVNKSISILFTKDIQAIRPHEKKGLFKIQYVDGFYEGEILADNNLPLKSIEDIEKFIKE